MEPNIPRGENDAHEAEISQNDLIDGFASMAQDRPFDDAVIVIFNLDTTDSSRFKEICQISARSKDNRNIFNQYIIPDRKITYFHTFIHKIQKRQIGNITRLYHNQKVVNALGPREGLIKFIDFLRNQTGQVLLAAQSIGSHYQPLIRQLEKHDLLDTFQSLVLGFIDTLPIFKLMLPERTGSFKLSELANAYLDANSIPKGSDAAVKAEILVSLITTLGYTDALMKRHAKNLGEYIQLMPENVEAVDEGLAPLRENNTVSKSMVNKMANAGISMKLLKDTYNAEGNDGVSKLLQEDVEGKPRVIKSPKIIRLIQANLFSMINHENATAN